MRLTTRHSLIILSVAAVIGVGIFLLRDPRTSGDANAPLEAAFSAISGSRSASAQVAIDTEVNLVPLDPSVSNDQPPFYVPVTARGDVQIGYADSSPLVMHGDWKVTDSFASDVVLGAETLLDGDGRTFMRISGLPASKDGAAAGVDVTQLNDKWFSIAPDMLASAIPGVNAADDPAVVAPRSTSALRDAFIAAARSASVQRYEDTRIDGTMQAHYALRPDPKKVGELLAALAETVAGRALASDERSGIEDATKNGDYLVDAFVDLHTSRFTVINAVIVPGEQADSQKPFSITVRFSDLDVDVDTSAPDGAVPFRTLLTSLVPTHGE